MYEYLFIKYIKNIIMFMYILYDIYMMIYILCMKKFYGI